MELDGAAQSGVAAKSPLSPYFPSPDNNNNTKQPRCRTGTYALRAAAQLRPLQAALAERNGRRRTAASPGQAAFSLSVSRASPT